MPIEYMTTVNNEDETTGLRADVIELKSLGHSMGEVVPSMSSAVPCKRFILAEMEAGWSSGHAPSARKQISVCLAGGLRLTTTDGGSLEIGPGDVWGNENTTGEGHTYSVIGNETVRVLTIQLE